MVPEKLINTVPGWLSEWKEGPVISVIVQVSRNLKGKKFATRLDANEKEEIVKFITGELQDLPVWQNPVKLKCSELTSDWLRLLFERKLITNYLMNSPAGTCILFDKEEKIVARINDRDHLRFVVRESGDNLEKAFQKAISNIYIAEHILDFAYDEQFGYLSPSPVYLGEGISLNALLHLPAIFFTRQTEKLFKILSKYNTLIWGLDGEGSEIIGSILLIKTRDLLMEKEESLKRFREILDEIKELESTSRSLLLLQHHKELEDRVFKSFAILRSARILGFREALELLSTVKLGVETGIVTEIPPHFFTDVLVFIYPEHIRKKFNLIEPDKLREGELRATLINQIIEGEYGS